MTIGQLVLAGAFWGMVISAFFSLKVPSMHSRALIKRGPLGLFLFFLGALLFHQAYGNRLLPPPNETAMIVMTVATGLCWGLALVILAGEWLERR